MTSSRHRVGIAVGAPFVAGVALWLTRASFDVTGTADAPQRVAMLPSASELAGLLVLALLVAAGLGSLLHRSAGSESFWDTAANIFTPAFALAVLAVPYIPWLPDQLPALWLLAGPGRVLIWIIVLGQIAWLFLPDIARRSRPALRASGPFAGSFVVFAASVVLYRWAWGGVTDAEVAPWLSLIAAAAIGAAVWVAALAVTRSKAAATFGWASVCVSAPFMLNSGDFMPGGFVEFASRLRNLGSGNVANVLKAAPGVFFDQEFGLAAYAPVLLVGFVGMAAMLRDAAVRTLAGVLIAASLLLALAGTVDPWFSETMMPGRGVLLL